MSHKDITIIITTYKSDKIISNCVNSIDENYKILIVENSNNKEFKNFIENKFKNVECILAQKNIGYAKANNLALKKIDTKFALILNPDTKLEKNCLKNFFKKIDEIDNKFSIIGPILNQDKSLYKNKKLSKNNLIDVPNVKGFGLFLNLEKIKKVDFFDENFFLFFEEIDLCYRLKKIGENIFIDPNLKIFHEGGSSSDNDFIDETNIIKNWHWMWSTFYYHKKHKTFFIALLITLPKFITSILKFIFSILTFKKKNSVIYFYRLSGFINALFGKKSWFRGRNVNT